MNREVDQVVRPPDTTRPALADPTTAILLTVIARRIKGSTSGLVLLPMLVLSVGTYVLLGSAFEPELLLFTIIQFVCVAAVIAQAAFAYARFGRALPRVRRLLTTQSWRPVPATVHGPTVVADGTPLRVPGMPDALREVIARTGRVWLVGPDANGWLALRIDGAHAPWPARRGRTRSSPPAREPEPPGATGTAADDPVAAHWATTAVRLVLLPLLPYVFLLLVFVALVIGLVTLTGQVAPWVVFGLVCTLPVVVLAVVRLRRTRELRALPRLLRAGPWTRVGVTLQPWSVRSGGTADGTGTLRLDGGATLLITLPGANVDLLGNIWETATVWLAGEPATGRTLAAGFPGYPILGVARLS